MRRLIYRQSIWHEKVLVEYIELPNKPFHLYTKYGRKNADYATYSKGRIQCWRYGKYGTGRNGAYLVASFKVDTSQIDDIRLDIPSVQYGSYLINR